MRTKTYAKIRLQTALMLARDLQRPQRFNRMVDGRGKQIVTAKDARHVVGAVCADSAVVNWYPATCGMLAKTITTE